MRFSNPGAPVTRKAAKPAAYDPQAHARLLAHASDIVSMLAQHAQLAGVDKPKSAAGKGEKDEKDEKDVKKELDYAVWKSLDEERYTFGPLYTPGEVDAHGEFVTAGDLKSAMRDFARSGVRTINKQHNRDAPPIGDIVDWVVWPYEQQVDLHLPGREVRKSTLPAGTAYIGVVWAPGEWPGVKGGAITGYSLGGRAMRVQSGEVLPPSRR